MANKIIMTDGSRTETIYKSINPWDETTPGVWSPDPTDQAKLARASRLVPSIFAGISARMQAMMDMPFCIYRGEEEVDNSDNYKNVVGFMPNPQRIMGLSEAALVTNGRAYWYKGKGLKTGAVKELKYWLPSSVTLDQESAKKGIILFERQGVTEKFDEKQVLYIWGYDEGVEIGAPRIYPLESALISAEANGAITTWVRDYMRRGAIKAMLLAVEGTPPPGEVDRMETWWNTFMSGVRSLRWKVFNAATVKPTIVGDGLEALKDLQVSKELRYEIHQALGTRHLLEDENLATAQARERQFYTTVIVPDSRLIQQALNDQILTPMGLRLEFEPERLEIFQTNEAEQVKTFGDLFKILAEVMTPDVAFQLASQKTDFEFDEEQQALIKAGIAEKKKNDEAEAAQLQKQQEAQLQARYPKPKPNKAIIELDKWEAKVKKAGKMVTWHAVDLLPETVKAVKDGALSFDDARAQLQDAPTPADVLEGIRLALLK